MMFDDEHIVTRLRKGRGNDIELFEMMGEAADEIERLLEWKEFAYEMRRKYWWFMRAKTLKKFDRMHNLDWDMENTK